MTAGVQVGLELDGTHATIVTVQDGTVVDIRSVAASTIEDTAARALATVPATAPVRVVLLADGVVASRVDVTSDDLNHAAFSDLAYTATGAPREGTTTAALIHDHHALLAGMLGAGTAAVAPADPVDRIYQALAGRPVDVVPSLFTAGALEGASLAIRHSGADLTLVTDGVPVAYKQLPAGGLDRLDAILGGGTTAGAARLAGIIAGQASADPMAATAAERYLRELFTDARDALDAWARQGERATRDLYVHGPGAQLPAIDVLLGDAGIVRSENREVSNALVHLAPNERPAAVSAFLAALTYNDGSPYTSFVAAHRIRAFENAGRKARRRRRVLTLGAAAMLLAIGFAGPATYGLVIEHRASSHRASAQAAAAQTAAEHPDSAELVELDLLQRTIETSEAWEDTFAAVADTPPGVTVDTTTAKRAGNDVILTIAATATDGDVGTANAYLDELTKKLHVQAHGPDTTSMVGDDLAFTVELTLRGEGR